MKIRIVEHVAFDGAHSWDVYEEVDKDRGFKPWDTGYISESDAFEAVQQHFQQARDEDRVDGLILSYYPYI